MRRQGRIWTAGLLSFALLALASMGWGAPAVKYSGVVMAIDKAAGRIVLGDMGPVLPDGRSEIARRTMQVMPSTEFVKVTRASGAAPSGWIGDYVETRLPLWEVKPGDFVTVEVKPEKGGPAALKITVVETSQP